MSRNLQNAVVEMEAILNEEALLLRRGSLASLAKLNKRKAHAWNAMNASDGSCTPASLIEIQRLAHRNAKLLLAAKGGMEAVQKLRQTLKTGPVPISTYTADGQKATLRIKRPPASTSRSV